MKLISYGVVCSILLVVLLILVYFLSLSTEEGNLAKGGPFECGFQPFSGAGLSFSMPFFVVSLMFLLFDVEILLVCFYPMFSHFSASVGFSTAAVILFILFSTLYEWSKGILWWV